MEPDVKSKIWSFSKYLFKFGITSFALYWVFTNTNLAALFHKISNSNPVYISLAFVAFFVSQIFASLRINTFFKAMGLNLKPLYNYKLYLLGMFYNIFLPGGVGGDGYKIFFLHKHFGSETKKLIVAILLDKLSGVWAICTLILFQILFIPTLNISHTLIITLIFTGTLSCYGLYQFFFKEFKHAFYKAHLKALGLQTFQVVCVFFILKGLGFDGFMLPYLVIFLASAFMALFPFTIGGLGSRELVFLYGADYLHLDPELAVTVSLMFFAVSAICSLPGAYFVIKSSALSQKDTRS